MLLPGFPGFPPHVKYDAGIDLRALPSLQSGHLACQGSLNPSLALNSSQLRLLLSHLVVQVSYMQCNCRQALLCLQQVWVGHSSNSNNLVVFFCSKQFGSNCNCNTVGCLFLELEV